ncbi:MAG TPA: hypothetical protein VFP34_12090 [Microlunatus sp.]|nr:hypothetical protein [Microlunatus sp.]
MITTTFGLGATDPSTHRAYGTSQGDDSLYVHVTVARLRAVHDQAHPRAISA